MSNYGNFGMRRFGLFPPVLKALMVTNVVVFLVQYFMLSIFHVGGISLERLFMHYFALQPIYDGTGIMATTSFYPWQLITYQFMHAGFWHIFFNMFMLWMFGSELEELWGGGKFLTFYLLSGIGAGLAQLFISPMLGTVAPTVGASGAVYGILLAFGLTNPDRSIFIFPFFIPIKAKIFVVIMIAIELIFGFSVDDQVARFAHLGGAATAFLLLRYGDRLKIYRPLEKLIKRRHYPTQNPFYSSSSFYQATQEPRTFSFTRKQEAEPTIYTSPRATENKTVLTINGEEITQSKIDEILDKISASGYQSLSEKEKYILIELSKKI